MARRCESCQPVRRANDAFGLWRNDFFCPGRRGSQRYDAALGILFNRGQTARCAPASDGPWEANVAPHAKRAECLVPFAGPNALKASPVTLACGGSDEAASPAFTRRSRHDRDVVATYARGVGRHYCFACRLCVPGAARARDGEDRQPAPAGEVRCARGAAMTMIATPLIATLLGWLMACLSTGPLLLALVMLA